MGGTGDPRHDEIENLMGTCREDHVKYGDKKEFRDFLITTHFEFLSANGVKYDKHFFD
jgi:predicted DNA-binding protein with PD1-like motif